MPAQAVLVVDAAAIADALVGVEDDHFGRARDAQRHAHRRRRNP